MRSIKLKIVMWILLLMSTIGILTTFGKNADTVANRIEIVLSPDPIIFTIESETLDKNEALQKVIELNVEEKDLLNQNLLTLNNSIRDIPYVNIEAKEKALSKYNIKPVFIKNRTVPIIIGGWISIILLFTIFVVMYNDNLYYSGRFLVYKGFLLIMGSLFILAIVKILLLSIPGYYLWQNIDKLF